MEELPHSNTAARHPGTVAGWREWVSLPDAGVPWIKAKLDTGARSSALHAFDIEEAAGGRVRFSIHPWQDSDADAVELELPVLGRRSVRSSSGHVAERVVVRLSVVLLGRAVDAEVTLTNRDEMGFRMLIGREALRQGFLVDPGASFLGGRAPRAVRRRNRGRA
ncbi:ATP-dependent zinc protease family protein [Agromyces archimandritae]|uniref:ATP-dependent zinc protease n=1 Tax=Agromyces archimandritae TaxID=2781962 RepID=A0A975FKK2_9MICO|nr:RimK/LysX family protein [Agromyces archimandritae]QTX03467.1 ATP-dependent zinc protease [Agromyces archimandritae]